MKSSMARFVAAYRWELLLFLVAPAVARLANDLTSSVFDSYFDSGWLEGRFSYFGHGAVGEPGHCGCIGRLLCTSARLGTGAPGAGLGLQASVVRDLRAVRVRIGSHCAFIHRPANRCCSIRFRGHRLRDVGIPGVATCAGGVCTAGISAQPHPCVLLFPDHFELYAASPVGVARQPGTGDLPPRGDGRWLGWQSRGGGACLRGC